jgi:putative alpha-1,2-mannosidase
MMVSFPPSPLLACDAHASSDSGAMGSYVVFILAGLYPVPSTRQYLIVSPWFPQINFTNPLFGTTTSIVAKNFNGNPTGNLSTTGSTAAGKNIFVKSVSINGTQAASNCYLDFDVFEKGGVVELEMTNQRNVSCGAGAGALPPSLSTGGL